MSDRAYANAQAQQKTLSGSLPKSSLLQRTCACGQHMIAGGECEEYRKKREGTLLRPQRAFEPPSAPAGVPSNAAAQDNGTSFDSAFDRASRFGHDFSQIPTHSPAAGAIQTKLAINEPGDQYEQEADQVSEQVMATSAGPAVSGAPPHIQRFSGQSTGQADAAPASVDQALASPGTPLELALRQDMEQHFGYDFSRVRMHSGAAAEQSAGDVNAHAYTVGHDIVFGAGLFAPETHEGRRLIAHELTHVVQQAGADGMSVSRNNTQRGLSPISPRLSSKAALQRAPSDSDETSKRQGGGEQEASFAVFIAEERYRKDKKYARRLGQEDAARIRESGTLMPELRQELNAKLRFFEGEARDVYGKEIKPALLQVTPPDEIEMAEDTSTVRTHDKPAKVSSTSTEAELPPFMQAGWKDVNEPGVIYKEGTEAEKGGAYLRERPGFPLAEPPIAWLPQNTKVHILRHNEKDSWYAVAAITEKGLFGYVADWLVARNPPDPDAGVVKIKPGDTPLELAARYYTGQGFDQWGKDKRYVVNALVWVNENAKHNFRGDPVIQKKSVKVGWANVEGGVEAPWWTAQVQSDGYMWLPGKDYLNAIYEEVAKHGGGTGSITADLWRTIKRIYHYVAYGLAFIGGLVHGFFASLWDAVSGLVGLVYDILKSVFTAHVVSDAKELISAIENLTWQNIKDAVGEWADKWAAKLNSDSPWTAGHAHGYLTGYVMAEAAMLLLSGGILAEAKGALWSSRLGKALQETRAMKAFAEGIEKAGEISDKARKVLHETREALKGTRAGKAIKAVETAGKAVVWTATGVGKVLNLPADIVAHLTEAAIARVKQLEPWFERIKQLSARAKRWLFGCHSPCDFEVDAARAALKLSNEEIEKHASAAELVTKSTKPRTAPRKETVEEFQKRGGKIKTGPSPKKPGPQVTAAPKSEPTLPEGFEDMPEPRIKKRVSLEEDHHIATRYREENKAIFKRAGLDINDDLNLIKDFPEHGQLRGWYDWEKRSYKFNMKGHHPKYNEWVTRNLTQAIPPGLGPDQALDRIVKVTRKLDTIIRKHPEVLSHGPGILPQELQHLTLD